MAAADYIFPQGELLAEYLPGHDLTAAITAKEANADADAEVVAAGGTAAAKRAYVYREMYQAAYMLASANPIRAGVDSQANVAFDKDQRRAFLTRRDHWDSVLQAERVKYASLHEEKGGTTSVSTEVVF